MLTNPCDVGVFRLDLIGGIQDRVDVGGSLERRRDRTGDPARRSLMAWTRTPQLLSPQRRAHQPLPVPVNPSHGLRHDTTPCQNLYRVERTRSTLSLSLSLSLTQ